MPTVTTFSPTNGTPPFQFTATLDGSPYNITTTWNVSGQRWFVNAYDQSGVLVFSLPLIGSPDGQTISLTSGYFASTLAFYPSSQAFVVTP